MNETRRYQVWTRNEPLKGKFDRLFSFARKRGLTPALGPGTRLTRSKTNWSNYDTLEDFEAELSSGRIHRSWAVTVVMPGEDERLSTATSVFFDVEPSDVLVTYKSLNEDLFRSLIFEVESSFGFTQLLSEDIRPDSPQATALSGCHFDTEGKAAADRLREFLKLLRFHRVEIADRFEGREIPLKVQEAITRNDIYIGVITGQRGHDWITAESAFAVARGKRLLLLKNSAASFAPTISGMDREFISFTHSIDEAFVPLLQGFRHMSVVGI
jgi:hypothetical protein